MSEGPDRVRLFAALDIPEDVRAELARWSREEVAALDGLRLVEPESFHVTLCFLGWREAADARRAAAVVERCAGPARGLALDGAAWFSPRRPRVLSAGVADLGGELHALHARLSGALAEEVGYEPEHRRYNPHVTVARARAELRRPPAVDPPAPLAFDGSAVTLYRSHLGRGGARYEPVARVVV
ncbi:MAG TPA: RNA 2',3'-cyclic phosphodiesterase [Solirubrobacteraceae bacterium]|nr:RNA 2',3'-cyclic phosphodiesterase [Solirubrobacteraceae bacterium]